MYNIKNRVDYYFKVFSCNVQMLGRRDLFSSGASCWALDQTQIQRLESQGGMLLISNIK